MRKWLLFVLMSVTLAGIWGMSLGCEDEKKTHQHVEVHEKPMRTEMVVE
jgi:hypothetical protein